MTAPVLFAQDRSLEVPTGFVIRTAYVPVENVMLESKDRMSVGDVDRAYQRRLQLGPDRQPWPCPCGKWNDQQRFSIYDGRHEYVATLMLGYSRILVAWIEPEHQPEDDPCTLVTR